MRALDKMVAIPVPGVEWALEGIFTAADSHDEEAAGAVVAPPHPLFGGSMDNPVVTELAYALNQAGQATLRFNWRGVGASGGAPSGEAADGIADYTAALSHLEETVPGPLVAAGYSFGAAAALAVAARSPRVRRVLLVAPPIGMLDMDVLDALRARLLVIVGSDDDFAPVDAVRGALGDDDPKRSLEVVDDGDHFFNRGLAEIGRRAGAWLSR